MTACAVCGGEVPRRTNNLRRGPMRTCSPECLRVWRFRNSRPFGQSAAYRFGRRLPCNVIDTLPPKE